MKTIKWHTIPFLSSAIISLGLSAAWGQDFFVTTMGHPLGASSILFKMRSNGEREAFLTVPDGFYVPENDIATTQNTRLTAFVATKQFEKDERGIPYQPRKLFVVDSSGKLLLQFQRVQRFSWSPDGRQLAYISGIKYEGFGFRAESLFVVSANGRAIVSVKVGGDQHISWANYDSLIYTTDYQNVYQYNPETGQRILTSYKGIDFSPDGEYYFRPNYEGSDVKLYERTSNREVASLEIDKRANFVRWLPGEQHVLIIGDVFKTKKLLDVQSRSVLSEIDGAWLGYDKDTRQILTRREGRISAKRLTR